MPGPIPPLGHHKDPCDTSPGPLTVGGVGGRQVGGGTAIDDGVSSQVRELGQGGHQGRGVCGREEE